MIFLEAFGPIFKVAYSTIKTLSVPTIIYQFNETMSGMSPRPPAQFWPERKAWSWQARGRGGTLVQIERWENMVVGGGGG